MRIGNAIGLAAIACGTALAQSDGAVAKVQLDLLSSGIATARLGVMGLTVKGAPYAADGVTETTQTLGDGTHISRQNTYTIYRDGEGRVRRENGGQVWISDPVANVSYVLNSKQQTARKLGLSRPVADNKMQLDVQTAKLQIGAMAPGPIVIADGMIAGGGLSAGEPPKREALGKQEMEGVEVEGTRTTTVIPQGQIGNDRPLQIVHERWESTELHVTILSKHIDPMIGEITERLTNVRRGEPDPALFSVPAGFKMEAEK